MGVALLAIGAHSAARVPDDLFIEDANDNKGFFSFLEPPARNGHVSSGTV
jgi:PRA1 family protein 1